MIPLGSSKGSDALTPEPWFCSGWDSNDPSVKFSDPRIQTSFFCFQIIPGCASYRRPFLGHQHCIASQEGSTAFVFSQETKESQSPTPIMCSFYRGTVESILTRCITVWYGAWTSSCRRSLQRIVRAATLPSLEDMSHTKSPQHCRWSHPTITMLFQTAPRREETA